MNRQELLFVYGTLLGGRGPLAGPGSRRLRTARLRGKLYDLGDFPALVPGGGDEVHGEIWTCSPETLSALDSYEGVDEGLFLRVRVAIPPDDCWTYVAGPALRDRLTESAVIRSGRWHEPRPRSP